ncbi:transporter [uncultured Pontibacter sp.]|uniref:transporter n=1 Tax=uncultured Pontibacter sp. TaxID=453356 RepID=UPI00260F8D00|nr:transporter [uncultured Pontibacter sp.]
MKPLSRLYLYFLIVLIAPVIYPSIAHAQTDEIDADRPDQSQGPGVVPGRTVQLEAGYFYQKRTQQIRTHAYPTALLRIGLLEGVELRIQGAVKDSVIENGTERHIKGWGPLSVGTKVRLWEGSGWRPAAALMAMVTLPLASEVFKPDNPEPQFNLGLANNLSEKMNLTYNFGYGWTGGDPVRSYGANITRELIDGLTLYLEVFGSKGRGETAEHQAGIGLLYLILPNLQFDVAAGGRLNKAAPHSFITSGIALRLPR